ncbi:unnamed protein product [Aureobasidium mustum]|uniref:Uncharacterized protein n=1 Tax=Aureobasidium mustum TaxID=2773714 RepID=A0A9N8KAZ4_9PEZI|nr:unnamed protein product [Aureobasidium mustum]
MDYDFGNEIRWDLGEEKPYEYWAELIGEEDSEDDNGASVVPAEDASIRKQITEVQDLLHHDPDTKSHITVPSDDEDGEPVVDEEKEIFQDTEFAVLALGEDPAHHEIESVREPADDEYEEDEDKNGIVVIKKRSDLGAQADVEEKLPVLNDKVARNYRMSINTIMLRYDANVKHTSRDKDIPKWEIVNCTTHKDIDTSASYAFMLGDQIDSLEEVAEHLKQEKTIKDGRENWIPFGDVYRHPTTHNIEVRAMSEGNLEKLAKAMDMSIEEVLKKLAEQVGNYER